MSSSNNETSNAASAGILLGYFILAGLAVFVVAVAAFMTLIAICAQFKTVRFKGETVTAEDGRWFIFFGLIGMVVVTIATPMIAGAMNYPMGPEWAPWLLVGGYTIGSLGISWLVDAFWGEEEEQASVTIIPPPPPPPRSHYRSITGNTKNAFEFASWYDEDEKR